MAVGHLFEDLRTVSGERVRTEPSAMRTLILPGAYLDFSCLLTETASSFRWLIIM